MMDASADDRAAPPGSLLDGLGPRPIVLAGFMGAGKSSLGRLVAAELGRRFVDTDEEAERIAGRSIADCFLAGDEAGFRRAEAEAVRRAAEQEETVIALGGGALLREETRDLLLSRTLLIHLHVPWSQLRPRIPELMAARPLLQGSSLAGIHRLYRSRLDVYRRAPVQVTVPRTTPEDGAARVLRVLRGEAPGNGQGRRM
jgi:shikimate kinase